MVAAEGITLFGLTVSTFSAFLLLGGLFAAVVGVWRGRAHGLQAAPAADMLIAGLLLALLMGRLLYVLNPPPSVRRYYDAAWYLDHIFDFQAGVIAVWAGGFSRGGLLLGALLGVGAVLALKRGQLTPHWWDALAWAALVAGVLVPLGVLLGGQVYGLPTAFPLGLRVDTPAAPYAGLATFHPVPAYLSLWAALVAGAGVVLRRTLAPGQRGLTLMAALVGGIFLLDFLTVDVSRMLGLSHLQWVLLLWGGAILTILQHNRSN
jgi:prolipoprotein diacylglyceryltransferase